jgi:hypothetical protein
VLHNFLDTYTSRYSDYRGYWLHGQLLSDVEQCTFNLLAQLPDSVALTDVACRVARRRFAEQLQKAGLALNMVREATLQITRSNSVVQGWHGGSIASMVDGRMVQFSVQSVMDNGRVYKDELTIFVAPHNPANERRRSEENWGT